MIDAEYVRLMAAYTHWQNESIYAAADGLTDDARRADRGAFFGSIHATLNHLLWADQLWMSRLADTPAPAVPGIDESLAMHADWADLLSERGAMDSTIREWSERVTESELTGELSWYSGALQAEVRRPRGALVVQLFNHGTHHRGQVHAMLTAAGARPADTDVPFMPDAYFDWP